MNIVVRSREKYCICRPDTSWERENRDIYVQDAVSGYDYAPVLFVRICKAGKCVAEKFAPRYFDGFNFGVLLSGRLETGGGCADGSVMSDCLDHSSILPFPLFNPIVLENEDCRFVFRCNGKDTYIYGGAARKMVETAISEVSAVVSLRIGDIVAVELQSPAPLCQRGEETVSIRGEFLGNETFDTRIIF
ncbi:MAG: hypothetical protein ACI39U_03035 [Candidatus Cryptobacteroides sp.]